MHPCGRTQELAMEAELAAVVVGAPAPAVATAGAHIHLAHRHGPARRAEKPALEQLRSVYAA